MSTLKVDTIDTTNSSGNITVSRPLSGSGASLTSLPAANLTGTIAAISGANLTNLNATNLASGTVATARLGSGTANNTVFLRGDGTWAVAGVSGITDNSDAVAITIDSSERVGIGTGSPAQLLHLAGSSPTIRVDSSTTSDDPKLALTRQGNAQLRGEVYYDSDQGILMVENLYDSSGADIIFRTRVGGTAMEALRLKGDGYIQLIKGIHFPATQNTGGSDANTLDDYEEGTFSLLVESHTQTGQGYSQTYSSNTSSYVKVGSMVITSGYFDVTSTGTLTSSHNTRITGFPFTSKSHGHQRYAINIADPSAMGKPADCNVAGYLAGGAVYGYLTKSDATTGVSPLTIGEFSNGTFGYTCTYIASA